MKLKPIKVSLLNQYVKKCLKSNSIFYNLRVEGEITNIRVSKTGYTYFSLSDETSSISCVCFFQDNNILDGDKVIVSGELTVYEAKGSYQIVVNNIEKIGFGDIFKELEILKEKLKKRGLFDKNIKVPLLPTSIGIITSKSGAALRDILKTFNTVYGGFDIYIYDSLVQGDTARQCIIDGLKYFNEIQKVDVIMVARGGGSFEDLKIFNDISIAESIFISKVPVVTGIGHDTDITLCDYTADVHCHTPTAAAEYIVKGYKNINLQLEGLYKELNSKTKNQLKLLKAEINTYKYILKSLNPQDVIEKYKNQCEMYKSNLQNTLKSNLTNKYNELALLYEKLVSHNYKTHLKTGYSLVFDTKNNLIKDEVSVYTGEEIKILFDNFYIEAQVKNVKKV